MFVTEAEYKGTGPKHKAIAEAIEILKKNLAVNEHCWNSHLWFAIVLGSKDKHDSFKQQIEEAFIIREHVDVSSRKQMIFLCTDY